MQSFTIGEAGPADIPALASLLAELFDLESDFRPDRAKQARGLQLIVDNPRVGRIFVVRSNEDVVGMANALFTVSTAEGGRVLLLEDVVVARSYRGQGLGKMLVQHVLAWARRNGSLRVTLLADRGNRPALRFYEGLGFMASNMAVYRHPLTVLPEAGRPSPL